MIAFRRRIIFAVCLPLILFAIIGCGGRSVATDKMDLAEKIMNTSPDSALSILDSIKVETLESKKSKARYALLKSMALDKNCVDTTTFDVLQPAIDYYLDHGTPDERLKTYYYQGRIYQNKNDRDSAMECFMRGREYWGTAKDTLVMANLLVAQAIDLIHISKYQEYINNNLEATKLYKAIGNTKYETSCLINILDIGIVVENKQLSDSVLVILKQRAAKDEELRVEISPYVLTYAIYFGDKNDIIDAINQFSTQEKIDEVAKMDIAEAYRKIGDYSNSLRVLNSIHPDTENKSYFKYLAIRPDVLADNGDFEGALNAYRDYSYMRDSINRDIFSHDLLFAKERYEIEKNNMRKIQERNTMLWVSLCIVFLLMIISGFIYYRYRLSRTKGLLKEHEIAQLRLEKENYERKTENLKLKNLQSAMETERQTLVAENLRIKIEHLEAESSALKKILEKEKDLTTPVEEVIKVRLEMLNGLLATRISENDSYSKSYKEWSERLIQDKDEFMNSTRLALQATRPRFIDYLKERGLTDYEINYVCLYAIGLRGKEVGDYMQLKRHYHISSDIRKKLGVDNEQKTNIGIYIRNLMKSF